LTPLVDDAHHFRDLAGISLDVTLSAPADGRPRRCHGGFLFTHRGYSGPVLLDLSHLAVRSGMREAPHALPSESRESSSGQRDERPNRRLLVAWTSLDADAWRHELAPRRAGVVAAVRSHLPARLAEALVAHAGVAPGRTLAELRADERRRLVDVLTR